MPFSFLILFIFSCAEKTPEIETKKETNETVVEDLYDVKEILHKTRS